VLWGVAVVGGGVGGVAKTGGISGTETGAGSGVGWGTGAGFCKVFGSSIKIKAVLRPSLHLLIYMSA